MNRSWKVSLAACLLVVCGFGTALASDWPTYNGDNRRSCVSDDEISVPLYEQWQYDSWHKPAPAWPAPADQDYWHKISKLVAEMTFDRSYKTVIADGRVYFGSSSTDKVYCLDGRTGQGIWSFFTEGPV
ncbi:MAG: PQQ-like beta-propeller repeat protein, partial [Anaerohalosphaera sp.]|nr:PQQ-like beta-propeller repeat protein [Anaerohalosphaera sp.]